MRSSLLPALGVAKLFFSQARLAKGSKFFFGGVSLFLKIWTHPLKTFYPLGANGRIPKLSTLFKLNHHILYHSVECQTPLLSLEWMS